MRFGMVLRGREGSTVSTTQSFWLTWFGIMKFVGIGVVVGAWAAE